MTVESRLGRTAVLLLAAVLSACGDSSGPGGPAELQPSQLPANAVVGSTHSPTVTVRSGSGQGLAGVTVSFQVTTGGGSVSTATATTDASGVATAGTWTLGQQPGTNTLVASAAGMTATFTVQTTPAGVSSIQPLAGVPTTGTVGELLTPAPGVRVLDQFGNPVAGANILFGASTGTVTGATQTADSNGEARLTSWQLGTAAGPHTWHVQAGTATASFQIAVQPGPPVALVIVDGNGQQAVVNREVPIRPAVALRDAFGNPHVGAAVTFAVTAGGGTVVGGSTTTDLEGIARVQSWQLGTTRDNALTASAAGVPDAVFTATANFMLKIAGDNTTCPISTTGCSFAVRVFNAAGNPAVNQTVNWTHSSGATSATMTDMNGFASSTNLATSGAPGAFTQSARLESVGEEHTFNYEVVQGGGFHIDIRFIAPVAGYVSSAFDQARLRWQEVITGNLPAISINVAENSCLIPHPALNEQVDDVVIFVQVIPIDGPGNVLGAAGPCWIRTPSNLPIMGVMRLDEADLEAMNNEGFLRDVVLHEIGHVLGLGSLWHPDFFNFVLGRGGADPRYTAARAVSRFVLGGAHELSTVPVENQGGAGSRDSHWRESQLGNELMTSRIGGGINPLSAITIGALLDMGYQVNFGTADSFMVPVSGLEAYMQVDPAAIPLRELPMPLPRRW